MSRPLPPRRRHRHVLLQRRPGLGRTARWSPAHVVEHALDIPLPGGPSTMPRRSGGTDFLAICRTSCRVPGVEAAPRGGRGISTISPAIVAVDAEGRALRPAILYGIDTRATRRSRSWSADGPRLIPNPRRPRSSGSGATSRKSGRARAGS